MATRKSKPRRQPAKRAAPRSKATVTSAKRKRPSGSVRAATRPKPARGFHALDLSTFPVESIRVGEKWLCVACVLDVFTRHLKLARRTAHLEIKRYTPSLSELYTLTPGRPWFATQSDQDVCPYCGSAWKWHARIRV